MVTLEKWLQKESNLDEDDLAELDYWIPRSVHMINIHSQTPATHKSIKEWMEQYKPEVIRRYSPETIPRRTRHLAEYGILYRPKMGSFVAMKYQGRIKLYEI